MTRDDSQPPTTPWEIPSHETHELRAKQSRHCVVVPVIDEGERIRAQLERMAPLAREIDVVIADGGSTDGSLDLEHLGSCGVRTLLVKRDVGRLGSQLRMAYAYALVEGYDGVVTVDGNGKDGVEAIPDFVRALEQGVDLVQGSRFVAGGHHEHTPWTRLLAIRAVHAPVTSRLAHVHYTDTTNGFRGYSRRLLLAPGLALFRDVFAGYEILAYVSVRAPRLGLRVVEVPVSRVYPARGATPTKLHGLRGPVDLLRVLWDVSRGRYDPDPTHELA